ncbi:MAG: hypothetical protein ABJN34_12435 [Litoreibacter sp.]|uniref:hypothetical protein n=1 Tax=Litoreibacter sp. TaxID=1969459 RepID=UPI00329767BD
MFKLTSTPVFVLVCCVLNLVSLYAVSILAALVMPADIVLQMILVVPLFLVLSSWGVLRVTRIVAMIDPEQNAKAHALKVVMSVSAMNLLVFAIGFGLIYTGFATPAEAMIICLGAMTVGFTVLRKQI